jgi:hypothetical protein
MLVHYIEKSDKAAQKFSADSRKSEEHPNRRQVQKPEKTGGRLYEY